MSFMLKILIIVIKRRIAEGEELEAILLCYPKLTVDEIAIIRQEVL